MRPSKAGRESSDREAGGSIGAGLAGAAREPRRGRRARDHARCRASSFLHLEFVFGGFPGRGDRWTPDAPQYPEGASRL